MRLRELNIENSSRVVNCERYRISQEWWEAWRKKKWETRTFMPTHCEVMEWDRDYWPLWPHTLTIVCNTYMMLGISASQCVVSRERLLCLMSCGIIDLGWAIEERIRISSRTGWCNIPCSLSHMKTVPSLCIQPQFYHSTWDPQSPCSFD